MRARCRIFLQSKKFIKFGTINGPTDIVRSSLNILQDIFVLVMISTKETWPEPKRKAPPGNRLLLTIDTSAKKKRSKIRVKMPPPPGSRSGGLPCSIYDRKVEAPSDRLR